MACVAGHSVSAGFDTHCRNGVSSRNTTVRETTGYYHVQESPLIADIALGVVWFAQNAPFVKILSV